MKTHSLFCFAVLTSLSSMAWAQQPAPVSWQPTQPAPGSEDYAGTASCASCHQAESKRAGTSQMGNSIVVPTRKYRDFPVLRFRRGAFTYTLYRDGEARLSVDDGQHRITEPIFAMIGAGKTFQAYLLRHEGVPYRAAVDFVTARGGLDLDSEADPAGSLEEALGRHHSEKYVRDCLACHSPASVTGEGVDLVHRPLGNTCEVCHGPGAKHVALERAGTRGQAGIFDPIFNPGRLSAADESNFCGQCHTTAAAMRARNAKGTGSVISEPYRLETSRCWNPDDRRIRCTACHDPHAPIVRNAAAYDGKCQACHSSSTAKTSHDRRAIATCPVGKHGCVECHMQRVSAPDTPIRYADHRIRIAKADTPFPE